MRGRRKSTFVAGLAFAVSANASAQSNLPASAAPDEPPSSLKSLVQNCSAHKFETTIEVQGEGPRKVRMCGTEGQSDADWILTLNDAAVKTAASSMSQEAKNQIIAAVSAEIARLKAAAPQVPEGPPPVRSTSVAPSSLSRDYASLPPLPSPANVAPPRVLSTTGAAAAGRVQGTAALPASPPKLAPRLTLRCATAADQGRAMECDSIEPSTLLVLRADEALPSGVQMRFLRRGTQRAELELPPLKAGQTTTLRVPGEVCAGVAFSKVEIEAGGGSIGQYDLRC